MVNKADFKDFNGQWVEIFSTGQQTDSEGRTHSVDHSFLDSAVANFDAAHHQAPIVIGHPETNAPAFGWTESLRVNGNKLEAQFGDVDSSFEQMVRDGRFKKRSASFYLDANGKPTLRHVGFLGAQPPAVKGLRDIQFSSNAKSVSFESEFQTSDFSEDTMLDDKTQQGLVAKIIEGMKSLLPKKDDSSQGATVAFSEEAVKTLVADSIKSVETKFNEKITALENENKQLKDRVNAHANASTHDSNAAFVAKLGGDKCPPAFLKMGIVEFMDQLAGVSDRKVTVVSFEEKDGAKKEIKTESDPLTWFKNFLEAQGAIIQFGEQYGGLKATGTDGVVDFDEARYAKARESMGLSKNKDKK